MTLQDSLVRAAVYSAERDEHGSMRAAAEQVIRVHRVAPLLEFAPVIDAVADWLDERRLCDEDAELEWYAQIERRCAERRAMRAATDLTEPEPSLGDDAEPSLYDDEPEPACAR